MVLLNNERSVIAEYNQIGHVEEKSFASSSVSSSHSKKDPRLGKPSRPSKLSTPPKPFTQQQKKTKPAGDKKSTFAKHVVLQTKDSSPSKKTQMLSESKALTRSLAKMRELA